MARAGRALIVVAVLALAAPASAAEPPVPWDGTNPFACELQWAGFGPAGPDPGADPYCVEFDKRRQNVSQLGVIDFLANEPARVAAASPKCFYFQSDHWRGSLVQDNEATKTYEWDGHYFFDKASGEGGAWVSNLNVAGQTGDPRALPGFPEEWKPFFGPGTGGMRTRNSVEADPRCVQRASTRPHRVYAERAAPGPRCAAAGGPVRRRRLGALRIGGSEDEARRALGPPRAVKRGWLRWCVESGGSLLAGQRGDRSGELGQGGPRRTLIALSTSRAFRHRGVGPGAPLRALRRALPRARRAFRYGRTTVFLSRPRSAIVLGVRRGRVRFVAVRDRRALRGERALRSFLTRAR
jgi:hypothetical protein